MIDTAEQHEQQVYLWPLISRIKEMQLMFKHFRRFVHLHK